MTKGRAIAVVLVTVTYHIDAVVRRYFNIINFSPEGFVHIYFIGRAIVSHEFYFLKAGVS